MAQIIFYSIEEIENRNEMNVHLVGIDFEFIGVDLICAICDTNENLVFMRVSAYFEFCDTICDTHPEICDTHET